MNSNIHAEYSQDEVTISDCALDVEPVFTTVGEGTASEPCCGGDEASSMDGEGVVATAGGGVGIENGM